MKPSTRWSSLALLVVGLGVFLAGGTLGLRSLARAGEPAAPAPGAEPAPAPPFEIAPCDALLMISGREGGILKPCGCFSPQRGGLSRRAMLWERSIAKAKASAALSIGDTLGNEWPAQNDIKAEMFRYALGTMGYAGTLLSASDMSPLQIALSQPYDSPATTPRPPLNVKVKANGPLAATAAVDPTLRFKLGDLPVRAVSVVDPTLQLLLVDAEGVADIVMTPSEALKALAKEPGLLIVAAHTMREDIAMIRASAADKADLVLVIDVPGQVASSKPVPSQPFIKPMLVMLDDSGKEVGLLRLVRTAKGWDAAYDAVPLDPQYEDDASKAYTNIEKQFASYRKRVREENLIERYPTGEDHGPTYVGSAACAACHQPIHESWQGTPHAIAMKTLEEKDSDHDPECVRCHSVGWLRNVDGTWSRFHSSFKTPEKTPALGGVGCENCHGPGSEHVKWPDKKDLFGAFGTPEKMWRNFGRNGCAACHDKENSHGFQQTGAYEKDYLPQVDHRDVPKDRRTHEKGKPPPPLPPEDGK